GVTVDRRRHQAAIEGSSLALTHSEFRLLDTLIRQPGRVFHRAELIDSALGEDTMVMERTIDVHIRALRRKLGERADVIETVRGGQLDVKLLREQIEFQIAAGPHCLCPVGTTGESPTLSHEEHERVISEVVQAARGRIKVMAGTGSNSTAEALRLTKWAAKEGADAALMVAPYYNKPTQEGFFLHYKAVAEQ